MCVLLLTFHRGRQVQVLADCCAPKRRLQTRDPSPHSAAERVAAAGRGEACKWMQVSVRQIKPVITIYCRNIMPTALFKQTQSTHMTRSGRHTGGSTASASVSRKLRLDFGAT